MSAELYLELLLVLVSHDVQNGISYDFDFVRWPLHFEFPSYTPINPATPTQAQVESDTSPAFVFRCSFLEHGGLKSVINALQRNGLPSSVDLSIRQDCYTIYFLVTAEMAKEGA